MATDVSVDDFTAESTLPLGDAPSEPASDTATPVESPVETPPEDEDPAPDAAAPVEAKPTQAGERNPDGTFKAKGKKDPQARIYLVTWEREEARREAAAARGEAEDLKRRLAALEAPPRQPASSQAQRQSASDPRDPEPNPEDATKYPEGQYDRQYLKDQARWEARQEFRDQMQAVSAHAQQAQRQQQMQTRVAGYQERMQAAVAADPDFVSRLHPAVVSLRPTSQLEPGQTPSPLSDLAEELLDSPHTPQLLQHFSEHPDDLRRFAQLQTRAALLKEFTRLETRFETAPHGSGPKAPVLSQAKPPIRPVGSAPQAVEDSGSDDEPLDVFIKRENARAKTERRR